MKKNNSANYAGLQAEQLADSYLSKQGLKIIEKNFYCRFGEIDLIALDGKSLVFIEVRFRKNENQMSVFETIDYKKCRKLVTTSEYYLNTHRKYQTLNCRYDVVGITGELDTPSIKWIKNAFQA